MSSPAGKLIKKKEALLLPFIFGGSGGWIRTIKDGVRLGTGLGFDNQRLRWQNSTNLGALGKLWERMVYIERNHVSSLWEQKL